MNTKITLTIDCEKNTCGNCQYKTIFKTGLIGEFHPKCVIFDGHYGDWGKNDMKRSKKCISSEKK